MMGGLYGGGLIGLLLLGAIIYMVVRLLPGAGQGGSGQGGSGQGGSVQGGFGVLRSPSPEEILDRRFAQGEIDIETYQVQRAALAQAREKK